MRNLALTPRSLKNLPNWDTVRLSEFDLSASWYTSSSSSSDMASFNLSIVIVKVKYKCLLISRRKKSSPEDAFWEALEGILKLRLSDASLEVRAEMAEEVLDEARSVAFAAQCRTHLLEHQITHALLVERCECRIHVQLHFRLLFSRLLRCWRRRRCGSRSLFRGNLRCLLRRGCCWCALCRRRRLLSVQ